MISRGANPAPSDNAQAATSTGPRTAWPRMQLHHLHRPITRCDREQYYATVWHTLDARS